MRQTFYISNDVSRLLKQVALEKEQKISQLVNEALTHYLGIIKKKKSQTLAIFKYAGKIKSFKHVDPLTYQRNERKNWDR